MPIRGFNLLNNQNTPNLLQSLGQSPFPLMGLERFMQKRGMNYPGFPQGGNFQGPNLQGPNSAAGGGNLADTLKVEPPEKSGGIKAFLSRFSRKRSK